MQFFLTLHNTPVILKQGEKDRDGYCGSTAAGTGLEQFVATTSQESIAFLSTEVKGEPSWNFGASVHQTVPEDINSLLETSGRVTDKALDVDVVNYGLEGTNPTFEVKVEQSRPPTDDGECLMDCLGSAPSMIPEQVPNNNPDHMHCANEDAHLVTMNNGECLTDCHGSVPSGIPEQVPNNSPDHMHCAKENADLVTTNNGECLMDCHGSAPSEIPGQVPNSPDLMQCAEDVDLVTTCSTNLLGSSAQDIDAGEEGINCCKGSQSFPDTDLVTNELHDSKRRKLISNDVRPPDN